MRLFLLGSVAALLLGLNQTAFSGCNPCICGLGGGEPPPPECHKAPEVEVAKARHR
jgi:hypothetical protein